MSKLIQLLFFLAGKRYIFDIQRTCREAYDLARRKLYTQSSSPVGSPVHYWPQSQASLGNDENGNFEKKDNETCELTLEERNTILQKEVKVIFFAFQKMKLGGKCVNETH